MCLEHCATHINDTTNVKVVMRIVQTELLSPLRRTLYSEPVSPHTQYTHGTQQKKLPPKNWVF